jgi:hypothetical protein
MSVGAAADGVEVSVLMPCLNEARTVAACVQQAAAFLRQHGIDGEVLVADNGSTDDSARLAAAAGARVISVPDRGYGNVLRSGLRAARGQYVIMGDADGSYDFAALLPFLARLRAGADLVVGNRFRGGIQPGAMPALHRYLGNPALSYAGRLFFRIGIGDFHCGLRGCRRDRMLALGLMAPGMEFASEMVVRATLAGLWVEEVPTTLAPDGRNRRSHLRSWADGWRHLRLLLLASPRWLFVIPGGVLLGAGVAAAAVAVWAPLALGVAPGWGAVAVACGLVMIGFQGVLCGLLAYAATNGLRPDRERVDRLLAAWTLERGLRAGALASAVALAGFTAELARRGHSGAAGGASGISGDGPAPVLLLSLALLVIGGQLILGSFLLGVLRGREIQRAAAAPDHGVTPAAVPESRPVPLPGPRPAGSAAPAPVPTADEHAPPAAQRLQA